MSDLNEIEEKWQKEFASLAEEEYEEPPDPKQKRCAAGLVIILFSLYIFIIGGASMATILFGRPVVQWDTTFLLQGTLFFGGFLLLLACLYLFEGEERI